jgi:GNAT superfamily N-acetyltransferase
MNADSDLPPLDVIVTAAESSLHPWVRTHVAEPIRRASLEEELGFWLNTAARDMHYATTYAEAAPQSGEPPEAYLDRWLPLPDGAHVLAGPRYLGRDPDLPFVGVSASDRPLTPNDRAALVALAMSSFRAFRPGFILLTTADAIRTWPDTDGELRQVVGILGDLRARRTPPNLSTRPRTNTDFYARYRAIHQAHVEADPRHARHARCEEEEDLSELAGTGLLHDVLVEGVWAGIVAAEPDSRRGVKGATVVEVLLDPEHRGRGFGKHLSPLLAKALPMADDECLMGTIHADNAPAYQAALGAGRVDVGGEVRISL